MGGRNRLQSATEGLLGMVKDYALFRATVVAYESNTIEVGLNLSGTSHIEKYAINPLGVLIGLDDVVEVMYGTDRQYHIVGNLSRTLIRDYAVANTYLAAATADPLPEFDTSGAGTLYCENENGDLIGLWDGNGWQIIHHGNPTLSLSGLTASTVYDVFGYLSSGAMALETQAWASATTRTATLGGQDGIQTKNGDATRRWLGTICINSSGGQVDDTDTFRGIWNRYNRAYRRLQLTDSSTHTYATNTWRAWNNSTAIRVEYVTGGAYDRLDVHVAANINSSAQASYAFDATNTSSHVLGGVRNDTASAFTGGVSEVETSGQGYHFIQATEKAPTGATGNFNNVLLSVGIWC